jgi:hypothetical protein
MSDNYQSKLDEIKKEWLPSFGFYATVVSSLLLSVSAINRCSDEKSQEQTNIAKDSLDAKVMIYEIKKPEFDKLKDFVYKPAINVDYNKNL